MIDLTRSNSVADDMTQLEATQAFALAYALPSTCECGSTECDYDASLPINEEHQAVAEALVLHSPLLRLVKERNAARELVKKLLYTAHLGDASQDKYDALSEAHKAVFAWKGGAQ